jgi:hypothetical protein
MGSFLCQLPELSGGWPRFFGLLQQGVGHELEVHHEVHRRRGQQAESRVADGPTRYW